MTPSWSHVGSIGEGIGAEEERFSPIRWRKSTASNTANRVEVAFSETVDAVFVRDSTAPDEAVLRFTRAEWEAFLIGVRRGEFDG